MTDHNVEADLSGDGDLGATLFGGQHVIAAAMSGDGLFTGDVLATVFPSAFLSGSSLFGVETFPPADMNHYIEPGGADSCTPDGLAVVYENNVPGPFRAETSWGMQRFYQPLPGLVARVTGVGTYRVQNLPSNVGAVKVDLVTGVSGGKVLTLRDAYYGHQLAITLDGTSRSGVILNDGTGAVVAQANPWGAAVPAGTPLSILFSWNALLGTVAFRIGTMDAPTWAVLPAGPWSPILRAIIDTYAGAFQINQVQVGKVAV
jgi:hypothetical protein